MAKVNIKNLAQKAIAGADDGIQKAAEAAKKAAVGVNDGFDAAKASVQKSAYTNKVSKGVSTCIRELEKSKKTNTSKIIQDRTNSLIQQLEDLTDSIKENPYECEDAIESRIEDINQAMNVMIESSKTNDEMLALTVMSKHYGDAIKACRESLRIIAEEKQAVAEAEAKKSAPTIVELKDTNIRILIPNGYVKAKYKNPAKEIKKAFSSDEIILRKMTSRSDDILIFTKTITEKAMPFNGKQSVIDGIHECLADNQGLIEVNSGKTKRGYDYIYSIVKTIRDNFEGALYFLRMNIGNETNVIEIQATFEEIGITGERESYCVNFAQNAELVSFSDDRLVGWSEDPYDPNYDKGIPMNLSEREGVDAFFPEHPLSQAREFLSAAINDQFLTNRDGAGFPDEDVDETENEFKDKYDGTGKQFFIDLFAKEPVLQRYTLDVEVQ